MSVKKSQSEVRAAIGALKSIVPTIAVISGVVNVLALAGSFYMLQVYDRVLSSRSVPTLVALSLLTIGLYFFQGGLEVVRSQILVRLGSRVDRRLAALAQTAVMRLPLTSGGRTDAHQPLRDVDSIRTFLSGQGPVAILDMPWLPIYIGFAYLMHPILGYIIAVGAVMLFLLTLLTEWMVREPTAAAAKISRERMALVVAAERNAEVLQAMGFGHRLQKRFVDANAEHLRCQERVSDVIGGFSVVSKIFRLVMQSGLLGVGAYLTLQGEMSGGAIIASSIAATRALSPIEIAIGQWRVFVQARQGAKRLETVLASLPQDREPLLLPKPTRTMQIEDVTIRAPGSERVIVSGVSFELKAGQALAVIGPSAAGKSTLARAITGVWPLLRGNVRLDGASLSRWSNVELGKHVGYLPQDMELFDGTITENITRFEEKPAPEGVIAAAKAAGVHELVLRLPNGYETQIGQRGEALSAGQRQRIALARALYGEPFLLVLDEPNSNLDSEGEAALISAIRGVSQRGGIAVVVSHRPSVLAAVDTVAMLKDGQLGAFGPKDEVLRKVLAPPVAAVPQQRTAANDGGARA